MKTCCVVVIGHVDHGKTSLVRAITGIETDRLPEEKARGLSITPGFAHRTYPGGTIDFVDAPGHEDFIQAMTAGATGARAALIVISAVKGMGAQTIEHLRIAELLGIETVIVAVNKSDLLDSSEQAARLTDVGTALSSTPFADAPLILCSALTEHGLDTLNSALEALLALAITESAPLNSYMAIDRVFSLAGRGTIVTGTLLGQDMSAGDPVRLLPTGKDVTIRGLQSRSSQRESIQVGERMAANLRGVAVEDISRGAVLCAGNSITASRCIDVSLSLLSTPSPTLKHMQDIRVLFGTSSEVAQVRLYGAGRLGLAQLRFKKPVVGYTGQRAILRRLSPPETIGGAVFLDPLAQPTGSGDKGRIQLLKATKARDTVQIAKQMAQENGGVANISDIARLARLAPQDVRPVIGASFESLSADRVCSGEAIAACKANLLNALKDYHSRHPLRAMAPRTIVTTKHTSPIFIDHVVSTLIASGQIRQQDALLAIKGHNPIAQLSAEQLTKMSEIEMAVRQATMSPPTMETLAQDTTDEDFIALLIDTNRLVALRNVSLKQTLLFHTDTLKHSAATLHANFPPPLDFTTGQARTALETSRKVIVPLLERFDSLGVTLRNGDLRTMAPANSVLTPEPTC